MSESPSEMSNKRSLRRTHSSSPNPSKLKKSMSKSRSLRKYDSRSSSRSSSAKSRSHSLHKSTKPSKRSPSPKSKRYNSRSRSYKPDRRSRKYYSRSKSPPRYSKFNRLKNENAEPCTCIGIFGLSKRTKEETLWNAFDRFGKIDNVRLIMDRGKRESLGYAFIDYKDIESAMRAMKEAHGTDIDGNNIRLDYSVGKKPASARFFRDRPAERGGGASGPNRSYDRSSSNKYRNNGHRDYRRRSRSRSASYRKRRDSRKGRSRSRGRSRSSFRGGSAYRKRIDNVRARRNESRERSNGSYNKRRRISSRRRSLSRRSSLSRNSSR